MSDIEKRARELIAQYWGIGDKDINRDMIRFVVWVLIRRGTDDG